MEFDSTIETIITRHEYLSALHEDQMTKPEIQNHLETPRSTVDRAIRDLQEEILVKRVGSEYRLTRSGCLLLEEYEKFRNQVASICKSAKVIDPLPNEVPLSPVLFDSATFTVAEPHFPEKPAYKFIDILDQADTLRGLTPVCNSLYLDMLKEHVLDDDLTAELIGTSKVCNTLSDIHTSKLEYLEEASNFTLFRTTDELPYTLLVAESDEESFAGIVTYDEAGFHGSVLTDDGDAITWAKNQYAQYKRSVEQQIA